jgi:nitronate monooxygenase
MEGSTQATGDRAEVSMTWPDRRILDRLGIDVPIIQAPMGGVATSAMVTAVARGGGLGSLPCALSTFDTVRAELQTIQRGTNAAINLNFFTHASTPPGGGREAAWHRRLAPYYAALGLGPDTPVPDVNIAPFGSDHCALVEELRPAVVSFHFGLPDRVLVDRAKAAGAMVLSSATTVEEAVWLEAHGCDAIIAQGLEAGGHRGMFLSDDLTSQLGTMALVPQVVDAVRVPVIAAGGIADGRGIAAALALGAAAVQIGTAFLFCPEAQLAPLHRQALKTAGAGQTAITNVFTGRPARVIVNRVVRELGPMSNAAPAFPRAAGALAPLRAKSEPAGSDDFIPLWCGQAAHLGRERGAEELTRELAAETLRRIAPN